MARRMAALEAQGQAPGDYNSPNVPFVDQFISTPRLCDLAGDMRQRAQSAFVRARNPPAD